MIALGGLMRDDNTASVQRVPCFGAVPLLGEPFKYTENTSTKTNLLVFLKPHIIKAANDIDNITNTKYNTIKGLYEQPVEGGTMLFPRQQKHMPEHMIPGNSSTPGSQLPAQSK